MSELLFHPDDNLPADAKFAKVAVERSIDRIDDDAAFTYRVVGESPAVGERVEVPLGRAGKRTAGIVVRVGGSELLEGFPAHKVKPIHQLTGARLSPHLVDLARWISEYYVCPLGMVLASMMPAAVKHRVGRRAVEMIEIAPAFKGTAAELPKLKPGPQRAWEAITSHPEIEWPIPIRELAGTLGTKSLKSIRTLVAAGLLDKTDSTEIRAATLPGMVVSVEADRDEGRLVLTQEQQDAVHGIDRSTDFGVHLLRGVTGSGKTEVYLRLIDRVLARNGSAIVLVPEIALTPQTAGRFTRRFGHDRVAVLHSGMTSSQRHREWSRAASGEARVVVGARSAIFAPVENLSLVVVDEEHDTSYKQDSLPRYNARDTAIKRAQLVACPVVLGSATPSLESWHNARTDKFRLWELRERVAGASMPQVRIVHLAAERRARAAQGDTRLHLLGPTLEAALEHTLHDGGQAILLLNRRGLAQYVWCRSAACGFVLSCDHCDAALVVHRNADVPAGSIVRCHHCDAAQRVPALCPSCGSKLATFGWGTQRAEEELASKLASMGIVPGETMLRLDSDEMKSAKDFYAALSRFARGDVRLLVGTQMLAKGLDYPNVRLVGVIDADTSLNIPDFRSAERTFQLVSQVAGRAGRGEKPGLVIIQTMNPEEPAIALAARHDFEAFAELELACRARSGLPPITRMARVVCRDEDSHVARDAAGALAERLGREPHVRVRGPIECTISRVAGFYRFAVEIVADRAGLVQRALQAARGDKLLKSDAHTAVDVDPVALL
ncbi:Primosomal protein N' [Phycisphaerales bacterium]|nr:Primosomal protein N' [Phycisphaerales bacterium]